MTFNQTTCWMMTLIWITFCWMSFFYMTLQNDIVECHASEWHSARWTASKWLSFCWMSRLTKVMQWHEVKCHKVKWHLSEWCSNTNEHSIFKLWFYDFLSTTTNPLRLKHPRSCLMEGWRVWLLINHKKCLLNTLINEINEE